MAKILLVRHGESHLNSGKFFFGWLNPDLTEVGRIQAADLIGKIGHYDKIYASPLIRAYHSAEIINSKSLVIETDERLKEINFGIFEGLSYIEIVKKYPKEAKKWEKQGINYVYKKGESIQEFTGRVCQFIDEIKNTDETYLIVTHFGVINAILACYISNNLESFWKFKSSLGSVSVIEFDKGYPILTKFS